MRVYDYITALTDKKVLIECYNRLGMKEFSGRAEDLPLRLRESLIMKHNVYIDFKLRSPVIEMTLA